MSLNNVVVLKPSKHFLYYTSLLTLVPFFVLITLIGLMETTSFLAKLIHSQTFSITTKQFISTLFISVIYFYYTELVMSLVTGAGTLTLTDEYLELKRLFLKDKRVYWKDISIFYGIENPYNFWGMERWIPYTDFYNLNICNKVLGFGLYYVLKNDEQRQQHFLTPCLYESFTRQELANHLNEWCDHPYQQDIQ